METKPANGAAASLCAECIRPNCNGQTHLTKDAYLGCSHCGIELMDIIELVDNASLRNTSSCDLCGLQYDKNDDKEQHFMSHFYNQPANTFFCMNCDKTEDNAPAGQVVPSAIKIASSSSNDKSVAEPDQSDGSSWNSEKPVKPKRLQGRKIYRCDICEDKPLFDSTILLNKHKKTEHGISNPRRFPCKDCPRVFNTASKYAIHRREHLSQLHPDELEKARYACRVCEEKFKAKPDRLRHENEVHRDKVTKLFNCTFCERTFKLPADIWQHLLRHMQRCDFMCDICGKSFRRETHVAIHRARHTDQKLFECEFCTGKTFKTQSNLKNHIYRMHTKKPVYSCDMCDKVFKDASDRRRHRWTHGGFEKKFKCHICDKAFFENKFLKVHLRSHATNSCPDGESMVES